MLVKFALRLPGDHRVVEERLLDAVPRVDECVVLEGIAYCVHDVTWMIERDAKDTHVKVLLR
jgi:hypothetical protein